MTCAPPIPSIAGMSSSPGPQPRLAGVAPRSTASFSAASASLTRKPIAHADGPRVSRNIAGWPPVSMLSRKLISPCAYRRIGFVLCVATWVKPSISNSLAICSGSGWVNSTNSKPSRPISFDPGSSLALSAISLPILSLSRCSFQMKLYRETHRQARTATALSRVFRSVDRRCRAAVRAGARDVRVRSGSTA